MDETSTRTQWQHFYWSGFWLRRRKLQLKAEPLCRMCLAKGLVTPARVADQTHDYKRNGTTTLFAALNMLDGQVIGTCMPRHRHREFLRFLKLIDQRTPAELDLHLIVDNYATHKTPAVKRWLKAHPRFHLHFTPTSASWLNMVERFFAEITRKRIRRGAFSSVAQLKSAIMEYLENHNADPKPFVWTKSAGEILEKVARAKQALESQH